MIIIGNFGVQKIPAHGLCFFRARDPGGVMWRIMVWNIEFTWWHLGA